MGNIDSSRDEYKQIFKSHMGWWYRCKFNLKIPFMFVDFFRCWVEMSHTQLYTR
jgi:hypothetical protein